ncbi:MAG TPA: UbiA family prenyltransferase [Terracidiphilus sp.]|nr:UbiA family prenyltransferase [Terracidiphilus sp.]
MRRRGRVFACYNGPMEDATPMSPADDVLRVPPSLLRWQTWRAHVQIARLDHWVKNVFVLPGIVVALTLNHLPLNWELLWRSLLGLLAVGLVASSNYVINEICDAPFDQFHPVKRSRPVPSGAVIVPLAYAEWVLLGAAGLALAWRISPWLGWDLAVLLAMGCAYNLKPLRTKDVPYVDVLTEAVNNPLRLLAGWLMVTATMPPVSLLLSYWLVGCYFMALKRFAEYRRLKEDGSVGKYRRSLAYFTPELLLYSVVFYAASSMLFFGAFLMRYRLELVLSFPLVAVVMAVYFSMAFKQDSPAEHPEKLYREAKLMVATTACVACMLVCLTVDMPWLEKLFPPTAPVTGAYQQTK